MKTHAVVPRETERWETGNRKVKPDYNAGYQPDFYVCGH